LAFLSRLSDPFWFQPSARWWGWTGIPRELRRRWWVHSSAGSIRAPTNSAFYICGGRG